jgi:hypothetical protein
MARRRRNSKRSQRGRSRSRSRPKSRSNRSRSNRSRRRVQKKKTNKYTRFIKRVAPFLVDVPARFRAPVTSALYRRVYNIASPPLAQLMDNLRAGRPVARAAPADAFVFRGAPAIPRAGDVPVREDSAIDAILRDRMGMRRPCRTLRPPCPVPCRTGKLRGAKARCRAPSAVELLQYTQNNNVAPAHYRKNILIPDCNTLRPPNCEPYCRPTMRGTCAKLPDARQHEIQQQQALNELLRVD